MTSPLIFIVSVCKALVAVSLSNVFNPTHQLSRPTCPPVRNSLILTPTGRLCVSVCSGASMCVHVCVRIALSREYPQFIPTD